jgi:hypothetical protein
MGDNQLANQGNNQVQPMEKGGPKLQPRRKCILQHWQPLPFNQSTLRINKPPQINPVTWSPPYAHFIKINFDGAAKGNPGTAGWGAVIKDSEGEILGLLAGFLRGKNK